MLQKLEAWHKTKLGLFVFAVLELALSYGFISLAIDKGNFLYYLLTIIFMVGFLRNFILLSHKVLMPGAKRARR